MFIRKLILLIAAVSLAVMLTATISAVTLDADNRDSQGILYTLDSGTFTAVVGDSSSTYSNAGYTGANDGAVVIPSTVEKDGTSYTVNAIGYYAFKRCDDIVSVSVPSTVKDIANCAFFDSVNLVSVNLAEGVETIGASAFAGCVSLENVVIPASVQSIGYAAFYSCKTMTSVDIPDGVSEIGNRTFACSENLANVTLPQSVVCVDDSAFNSCTALKTVTLPANVDSLGRSTFSGCTALESLFMYKSLATIGDYAFWGCDSLKVYLQQEGEDALEYMQENSVSYALKGDVDGSGSVDIADAIYLAQHLANSTSLPLTDDSKIVTDTVRDGDINISDAISLAQYLAARNDVNLD